MSTDNSKRIWVSIIGCGGCGGNLAATAAKLLLPKNNRNGNMYLFRWYLYDMSYQVFGIADTLAACNPEQQLLVIKPTLLDPGLGRVPISAEIVFQYMPELSGESKKKFGIKTDYKRKTDTTNNFFDKPTSLTEQTNEGIESSNKTEIPPVAENNGSGNRNWEEIDSIDAIFSSSINVYMSSLGGGTGGRSVSLMIPKIRDQGKSVADVAICVITSNDEEELNNIYNVSHVNNTADFTVLLENGVIAGEKSWNDDKFINEKAVQLLDMIISTRLARHEQDIRNLISFLRRSPNYYPVKKNNCLVPFVYPLEEEYIKSGYDEKTLLDLVENALKGGGLCSIPNIDIDKCEQAAVIIKAPKRFLDKFDQGIVVFKNGEKKSNKQVFREGLQKRLGLATTGDIWVSEIDDEEGLKICLFLYRTPLSKLQAFRRNLVSQDLNLLKAAESWKGGVADTVETLKDRIKATGADPSAVTKNYQEKVELQKLTQDFLYQNSTDTNK